MALTGAIAALVFAATVGLPEARFGVFPPAGDPALPAVTAAFVAAWRAGMLAAAALAALAALAGLGDARSRRRPIFPGDSS